MEVLLGRDGAAAVLLVKLAEAKRVDLVVPDYVLLEFRGTALRWIRDELERLNGVRRSAKEWARSQELDKPAEEIKIAAGDVEQKLKALQSEVEVVIGRIRSVARVTPHTPDAQTPRS